MPERIKHISKQFLFTTEESKSSLLVLQPWVYFQSLKCGGFYGSQDLFWFFLTFRLVQWKVLILYRSQTSSCMFSTCLYLLEWKKSFHLSEISPLTWIPRQNFTEMWAPLKFLLFPVRADFLLSWRKIWLFRVRIFLTQLLGMGCNLPFVAIGPCSESSWPSQWTLDTVTPGTFGLLFLHVSWCRSMWRLTSLTYPECSAYPDIGRP